MRIFRAQVRAYTTYSTEELWDHNCQGWYMAARNPCIFKLWTDVEHNFRGLLSHIVLITFVILSYYTELSPTPYRI